MRCVYGQRQTQHVRLHFEKYSEAFKIKCFKAYEDSYCGLLDHEYQCFIIPWRWRQNVFFFKKLTSTSQTTRCSNPKYHNIMVTAQLSLQRPTTFHINFTRTYTRIYISSRPNQLQWVSENADAGATWRLAYEVQINMGLDSERVLQLNDVKNVQLTNAAM